MRENWFGNPVWEFLKSHGLTPPELAMAAGVEYTVPYLVLNCYVKRLPQKIVEAVDRLDGDGAGDKLNKAYELYRDGLAHDLLTV